VFTVEFDPPIRSDSNAASLLERAGAQLIHVDEENGSDFDKVETAVLIPDYALTFASPRGDILRGEELQGSLRDRTGALIEGAGRSAVEGYRLDHQLQ